jgi:DNA-binding transcriptional LysR family regulator
MHGMKWEDLRVFLAVARQRSHAAAGRVLRVDASTVGRRIVALEGSLGTRLFDRKPDGLTLTEPGAALLGRAECIEKEALAAERELLARDERLSGRVRLTASDGVVDYIVVPNLVELHRAHPGLDLVVRAESRLVDLSRREADVALRLFRPRESTLVGRRLGTMHFGFFASRSYLDHVAAPRGLAALAGHTFIGFDVDQEDVPTFRWLRKQVPEMRLGFRANTTAAQVKACIAGFGIALLPRFVASFEPALVDLIPRLEGPTREIWAVAHRDLRQSPRVSLLIEWLTRTMAHTRGITARE